MTGYFGFDPTDWLGDGFTVELRFREPPTDEWFTRFGTRAAAFGPGDLTLRTAGPFVVIELAPHPKRERRALSELRGLLAASAGEHLLDAVVLDAIQDGEPARPREPGPALPGSTRPVDPALPEPSICAPFEAAVRAVGDLRRERELAEFLAQGAGPVTLAEADADAAIRPPVPDALRGPSWRWFRPGAGVFLRQAGEAFDTLRPPSGYTVGTVAVVRGDRALLTAETAPRRHLRSEGPTELLLLEAGTLRPAWRLPDVDRSIESVAWLDDDHAVVGSRNRTILVRLADGAEVASAAGGGQVSVGLDGRVVVSGDGKLRVLGVRDGALGVLARFSHPDLGHGPVLGEVPTVRVGQRYWRLEGLRSAWDGATPKAPAKRVGRKPKPALEPLPYPSLAPDPPPVTLTREELAAFAAAGFDVRPKSRFKNPCHRRVGDRVLGVCAAGIAVRDGDSAPRLLRWTSPSGYDWALSRMSVAGDRVFASDSNTLVEGPVDGDALTVACNVVSFGRGHIKDFAPLSADELVILTIHGIVVAVREGAFVERGFLKITKPTHFLVWPERRQAWVATEAKHRLVLVDLDGPKALATFTEDANDLRRGAHWEVSDPRRQAAWRVTDG